MICFLKISTILGHIIRRRIGLTDVLVCFIIVGQRNLNLGGLISNTDVDTVIDEYCKWIDLSVKLPRMPTTLSKYRYAIEIMIKEAVLYLLCEKKQFTREKAEEFLTDSQDAAFARERG
jgi:hypothetical protein